MRTLSVALDLGSTRIKAARLGADGRLGDPVSEPAPPLRGDSPVREGDAAEYLAAAGRVLDRALDGLPDEAPLGLASQRSTFLLWERDGGRAVTPMISWQDRRAAEWCARHADHAAPLAERTGLLLSPHYLGPKLATLLEADAELRRRAADGDLLLGTMDAWLVWHRSRGAAHRTDATMAARTMLLDLEHGDWSDEALRLFGIPRALLPEVRPSVDDPTALAPAAAAPGARSAALRASLADQASGLLAVTGDRPDTAMVNLGTGTFVLRPTEDRSLRPRGFLVGPALVRSGQPTVWALEGPVNGGAAAVGRHGPGPTALPPRDPSPDAFCLPDSAGIGAPHWRSDLPPALSEACAGLPPADLRRVTLEGLAFRVREVLDGLFPDHPPREVLLAGGLSHEPFLPAALAAVLGRPVTIRDEKEATLLGVARLAAETAAEGGGDGALDETVAPPPSAGWLAPKYERWAAWRAGVLATAR